jgi:hypothetical protein
VNRDSDQYSIDMSDSEGKSEDVSSGVKECGNDSDMKSDSKDSKQEKPDGKSTSHLDDKKIDDDITAIFEKGMFLWMG